MHCLLCAHPVKKAAEIERNLGTSLLHNTLGLSHPARCTANPEKRSSETIVRAHIKACKEACKEPPDRFGAFSWIEARLVSKVHNKTTKKMRYNAKLTRAHWLLRP